MSVRTKSHRFLCPTNRGLLIDGFLLPLPTHSEQQSGKLNHYDEGRILFAEVSSTARAFSNLVASLLSGALSPSNNSLIEATVEVALSVKPTALVASPTIAPN